MKLSRNGTDIRNLARSDAFAKDASNNQKKMGTSGGEGGIRTPDRLAPMPHFECGAFNHSATSPGRRQGLWAARLLWLAGAITWGLPRDKPGKPKGVRVLGLFWRFWTPCACAMPVYSVNQPGVAPMAELVDASDSKSDSARSAGSIPARGTISTKASNFAVNLLSGISTNLWLMDDSLQRLYQAILAARAQDPTSSKTSKLFHAGIEKMAKKLAEEAVEVGLDAVHMRRDRVILESADLLYNLAVLWAECGITPEDVSHEIARREELYGIAEKLPKTNKRAKTARLRPLRLVPRG